MAETTKGSERPRATSKGPAATGHRVAATGSGAVSNVDGAAPPAGSGDTGPGSRNGIASPADTQKRTPDRGLSHRVGAAPLEAADAANQTVPEEGVAWQSTNPVADAAGRVGSHPGDTYGRLVGADGAAIAISAVFAAAVAGRTYRVVEAPVLEEFFYAGSDQPMRRLLYPRGARVSLADVARITEAVRLGGLQRAQELASNPARP